MIQLLFFLISLLSWAKFDLTGGIQGRTLPALGAELYAESGYNQLLWGKKNEPKDILYGLIRPSVQLTSSAVINAAKAEVELFPLSIIGFSAGSQIIHSNFDFPFFDCDIVDCDGEFRRNFVEAKMVLGAKGFIALGNYKIDTLTGNDSSKPMADWRNVIVGNKKRDTQIEKKLLLGKVFGTQMVGFLSENVQFIGSEERKESYAAVYQFRKNDTSYMIGAGAFHTSQEPMGLIFYFRVHQVWLPSLKLF